MPSQQTVIPCPFVYANGRACAGHVISARAYGPRARNGWLYPEKVRKYRLICSEKNDHAGILHTHAAKLRMEFYPDELPPDVIETLWREHYIRF